MEALIAHGRGDLASAREKLADGLAGEGVLLAARYAWPLLWLGMRAEADDATRSRDRREAAPDAAGERRRERASSRPRPRPRSATGSRIEAAAVVHRLGVPGQAPSR